MDVEWLQTFLVAADEENFHRAALRLHLAQPTVTQQIRKLEEEWGVTLFHRIGRNVRLSHAGRRFRQYAEEMWTSYQESRVEMARWQKGYDETVEIAVSPLVATTYLPLWIRGFSKKFPNIEFSLNVKESSDVADSIIAGQCDIGFSRGSVAHPNLRAVSLYDDPVVLVAPVDTQDVEAILNRSAVDLLHTHTVLTGNHPDYWDELLMRLRREFPTMRTMHVNLVHVTIHFIIEKMGISFLPQSTVRRDLLRGTLEEIPFPFFDLPTAQTYLITGQVLTQSQQAFVDYVEEYMRVRPV